MTKKLMISIFVCMAIIITIVSVYLVKDKDDKNGDLPEGVVDVEWYQDDHPSDLAILRFSSDHTISYYEVGSGNGYDGDFDMCDEYTYDSSTKEIKLNCEHTMRLVQYEDNNKLTLMVGDEEIVYYNSEELLNQ